MHTAMVTGLTLVINSEQSVNYLSLLGHGWFDNKNVICSLKKFH